MAEYTQTSDSRIFSNRILPRCVFLPEIGRNLCRVKYGGYRKDIVTENLNEREKRVLLCKMCQGIMKDACISSRGEQFCLCCKKENSKETPNITVRETINSLKCSCPLIERGCKWLGTLEDCEDHLDRCGYVYERCKLKCGVVLGRDRLRIHEKEKCPQRKVKCDHCEEDFKSCEINKHLDKCPKMEVLCNLKCGLQITREDIEQHLKHDCGMVEETCRLGCGVKLIRNELKIHEKDTCEQRKVQCEHCHDNVQFCDIPKHLRECPKVIMSCDLCSEEKYRKDLIEHLKDYCPESETGCPFVKYRCLARMKRKDIDKHLEEKETKHLGLKLTAMEDLITKQREEMGRQKKEMRMENEIMSQQIELLYTITNITRIFWKIENVTDLMNYCGSSSSKLYEAAGYTFAFKFCDFEQIRIVFSETTLKHDTAFIAKCYIVLLSCHTIDCGPIEVKQKDLTKGCERNIASISHKDIEKYSRPNFHSPSKKDLILEIYLTIQ